MDFSWYPALWWLVLLFVAAPFVGFAIGWILPGEERGEVEGRRGRGGFDVWVIAFIFLPMWLISFGGFVGVMGAIATFLLCAGMKKGAADRLR